MLAPGSSRTAGRPVKAACPLALGPRARAAAPAQPGKKLDRGKRPRPLIVPDRLLRISRALRRVVTSPLELGLAVLPAHPHDLAPVRRIRDQPHDLTGTTLPAATAFQRPAPQRHRELGAA